MQNFNPFTFWQQAFTAPAQIQATYWQTVSTIMQQRAKACANWQQQAPAHIQQLAQSQSAGEWQQHWLSWCGQTAVQCATLGADTHAARTSLWSTWQQAAQAACSPTSATWQQPAFNTPQTSVQQTPVTQPTSQTSTPAASALQSALNTIAAKAKAQPTNVAASTATTGPTIIYGKLAQTFGPSTGFAPALPGTFIPAKQPQQKSQPKSTVEAQPVQAQPAPKPQATTQQPTPKAEPQPTQTTAEVTEFPNARLRQTGGHGGAVAARASAATSARHSVVARRSSSRRTAR